MSKDHCSYCGKDCEHRASIKPALRCLAFTLAPSMTDASGLKLGVLAVIVGISAMYGWD